MLLSKLPRVVPHERVLPRLAAAARAAERLNVVLRRRGRRYRFHADVHAGNLLALSDGRVAFIDFGIVGRIPPATAEGMLDFVRAFPRGDMGGVAAAHRQLLVEGALADAILCTANGRLLRRVPEHVHLRAHVHEARWLVGDALPLEPEEASCLAADPTSCVRVD